MALRDTYKDKVGSHKLWEGVWKVQASLNNLFGGDWGGSDSATGWRSQQGAADQCTQSDWCLAGACFCSLTSFTPGIRCWRWEKTSWHLALLLHHPIATAGCFKPVWSLAWLKVEAGTDVFVVCRSCTFWGWRGPPQSELVPSVAPG